NNENKSINKLNTLNVEDYIGQDTISLYFSSAAKSVIKIGHELSAKDLNKDDENIKFMTTKLSEIKLAMEDS
ncbi:9304_t:CDS:1, partial [Dentiscutata erythropus]